MGRRLGPTAQKILLLLEAGIILGLTQRPDHYFRVLKKAHKAWKEIDAESMHKTIKRLYHSKLIDYHENRDKTVSLVIAAVGEQKILRYRLENMKIQKPPHWDGLWGVVIFDIPERFKKGRVALACALKNLGFHAFQKSVFVHPYPCKDEIDFVVEMFELRPYVRFLVAQEVDVAPDLKRKFHLKS